MQKEMNWKNLKNNNCPKCNCYLVSRGNFKCSSQICDFFISEEKFNKIVDDLYKPKKYRTEIDNLSELNNLGRKEVTEDFSDSKFLDY